MKEYLVTKLEESIDDLASSVGKIEHERDNLRASLELAVSIMKATTVVTSNGSGSMYDAIGEEQRKQIEEALQ